MLDNFLKICAEREKLLFPALSIYNYQNNPLYIRFFPFLASRLCVLPILRPIPDLGEDLNAEREILLMTALF